MSSKPPSRSKIALAVLVWGAYLAGSSASPLSALSETRHSLGGFPLCEASAALLVRCPDADRICLLVGDDEQRDTLFLFDLRQGEEGLSLERRREISLKTLPPPADDDDGFELSDIEAMAGLPSGEVMIFGSHSRDKTCDAKKSRRIFASVALGAKEVHEGSTEPVQSRRLRCERLFPEARGPLTDVVCEAVDSTEAAAEQAHRQPSEELQRRACNVDPAFNLEGAVAVPDAAGEPRVWIGLRAPLIDGKAVLLRQVKDRRAFAFDAVTLLDLRGLGVRELTFNAGKVWGIAGPAVDSTRPHMLWSVDAKELKDGARLLPATLGELPTSAEGLAISQGNAIVLMDGDQASEGTTHCTKDSEYIVRRIVE